MDLFDALIKPRPEWDADEVAWLSRAEISGPAKAEDPALESQATTSQRTVLKVVMTGSAEDGLEWQRHIGNKEKQLKLANRLTHPPPHGGFALRASLRSVCLASRQSDRLKDAKDPFKIVIVRDMWLTGFDAPCLHTMYADVFDWRKDSPRHAFTHYKYLNSGGQGEIRTLGAGKGTHAFQACAIDHSATCP